MSAGKRIAVLGAGIMGVCCALMLARRGHRVTLVEAAAAPLQGASRWNEGKIHLGYLYSADASLETARRVLPGGLAFGALLEELLGHRLDGLVSREDDLFLMHRDSVVDVPTAQAYFDAVSRLVREHPEAARYLADASGAEARPLSPAELEAVADPRQILAGFRVPERSVRTTALADALTAVLAHEPRIELHCSTRVLGVAAEGAGWRVQAAPALEGRFDCVINALWEQRLAVDHSLGLAPEGPWLNRYRVSLFVHTAQPVELPCMVVATGPFGDIKNYDGRNFYLSWYPAGLLAEDEALLPRSPASIDTAAIIARVREALETLLPGVAQIFAAASEIRVAGGWVFAYGQGVLSDPAATLHQRSQFGIRQHGSYFSVDTGKYSTAPWLARRLVAAIEG